jgi:CheY-like chemotaxis protein
MVNLRILKMYCTKRGLPFHCATDGKQAVEIFTQQQTLAHTGDGTGIHLIIMDLQMPVCGGIETMRQTRQLEKQNKWDTSALFIVTGQDSQSDRSAAEDVGTDEYYVKPVGVKVLVRGVAQYFPRFEAR